jgi:hypothetical protein
VTNKRIVHKTAAACRLVDIKEGIIRRTLENEFAKWRLIIANRKNKLLRKYSLLWMTRTRCGYQQCFWRWMFVVAKFDWASIFPNHHITLKKMIRVINQCEFRTMQRTFLKIVVSYANSPGRHVGR